MSFFWNGSRGLAQMRFPDAGVEEVGEGIARISLGGCFEHWLSCEYQTLYCLDSSDLIYQNEVIHPAREDKPSFQRINQAHQGPCLPPYLQPVREGTVINLTGPREPRPARPTKSKSNPEARKAPTCYWVGTACHHF